MPRPISLKRSTPNSAGTSFDALLMGGGEKRMTRSKPGSRGVLRPPEVRGANRAVVLRLLRQNGYLSRADVARESGLSEGAISRIVTGLIDDGLVREDGAENTTGGRPGRRLALESRRVVFGAEIQNWETRCVASTMRGQIVATQHFRTPVTAEETLDELAACFREFRKRYTADRLPGIGICTRGIVNRETGTLVLGSRSSWRNVPIREMLESKLREPVFVENNVRAAAIAEYTYGNFEFSRHHCLVFVVVDEGVGMAIVFDGKLYHGPHMAAGELGEMIIRADWESSDPKAARCVEDLVSNGAIAKRYSEYIQGKRQLSSGDTTARVRRIVEAALSGDAEAKRTLTDTARYLGIAISNLVWALDADTIVIDGAITAAWPIVEPVLKRELPDYQEVWGSRNFLLRPSALGGEAALIGAASLPVSMIFAEGAPVSAAAKGIR